MELTLQHEWNVDTKAAKQLQLSLANDLTDESLDLNAVRTVAGVDVSVQNEISRAAVVVMTYPQLDPIETVIASQPTPFPYVPGLLTFREGPVLVEAFERLQHVPDVFMFDGMGRIHPRRMGIAAHMGLWLDKPTIGIGKTHFIGEYVPPATLKGSYSPLTYEGEVLGAVVRTRRNVKPLYVSAGHKIDLESALLLTLACTPRYRLPRPIRLAHNAAGQG